MGRLLAACVGLVLFVGCTSDEAPTDEAVPASVTTSPTLTSTPRAAETPWVEPTPPEPTATPRVREVGESVAVEFGGGADVELVRFDPEMASDLSEWWWQKLYRVDSDELWTVVDAEGIPYALRFDTDTDRGIGTAARAGWSQPGETVLVDLETGEVTELLPYPAGVVSWSEPQRVVLQLLSTRDRAGVASDLVLGIYELDLVTQVLTLMSRESNYREIDDEASVPAESVLPAGAVLERRLLLDEGWWVLVVRDEPAGTEEVVAERLQAISWAPDGWLAALASTDGKLRLFDVQSAEVRELGAFGPLADLRWSTTGRYLVMESYLAVDTPERSVTVFDLGDLGRVRVLGPFNQATFADWGVGAEPSEVLLLGEYCQTAGFWLDRLDLMTGELTRLETEAGGFWVHDWSPRGDWIAVSSWDVAGGFALVDAVTGVRAGRPELDAMVTSMQDVVWSASGDWIALGEIGGRDRCWV